MSLLSLQRVLSRNLRPDDSAMVWSNGPSSRCWQRQMRRCVVQTSIWQLSVCWSIPCRRTP
jgi:hypothetical protein